MHFLNKGFLKLTLLPGAMYRNMGVDTRLLEAILKAKLTIDDRRPNTLQQVRKKSEKPVSAATIGTLFVSAFLGLLYLIAFFFSNDTVTALTYYFSIFFFMLSASLISDFTSVLIDVRDNYIILPKPVNDRTIVVARVLHIFIHVCKLIVPMCLPGAIYMGVTYDLWAALVFLLMVLLLTIFVLFFINALYLLMLRITTPARFQAIISYVQIIFAITIYASYQVLPHFAERVEGYKMNITEQPLLLILPTYWFAGGWHLLYNGSGSTLSVIAAMLCVVVPLASMYVMIRYLAPSFNNRLSLIGGSSGTKPSSKITKRKTQGRYLRLLTRWFTRPGAERMGFLFTWKMTARSRDFKIKVYPAIGYMFVYILLMWFRQDGSRRVDEINEQALKVLVVGGIYVSSYLLIAAVSQIRESNQYKAAWIFFATPLEKPGAVILGGVKAAVLKFFIPMASFITGYSVYLAGLAVVPNLILGFLNQLLAVLLMVYIHHKILPFTLPEKVQEKAGAFIKGLTLILTMGLIGIGHFLIYDMMPAVLLCVALSGVACWYLMGSISGTSWTKIMNEYDNRG